MPCERNPVGRKQAACVRAVRDPVRTTLTCDPPRGSGTLACTRRPHPRDGLHVRVKHTHPSTLSTALIMVTAQWRQQTGTYMQLKHLPAANAHTHQPHEAAVNGELSAEARRPTAQSNPASTRYGRSYAPMIERLAPFTCCLPRTDWAQSGTPDTWSRCVDRAIWGDITAAGSRSIFTRLPLVLPRHRPRPSLPYSS